MFKEFFKRAGFLGSPPLKDHSRASMSKSGGGHSVYFPVESLVGLGHFNRTGALVRAMIDSDLDVNVASGTFVDQERFFAGANTIEIPPYVFTAGRAGDSFTINADGSRTLMKEFNMAAHEKSRIDAHLSQMAKINPNILITEFWPFDRPGLDSEMCALLKASKGEIGELSIRPSDLRLVSLRDVMDTPDEGTLSQEEINAKLRAEQWTVDMVNANYHAVLVHGDPAFIPLNETFKSADKIKANIIYTGYVVSDLPTRPAVIPEDAPYLVSCGSGVDGHEMLFSFMTAWEKLLERRKQQPNTNLEISYVTDRPLHIITGPRFSAEHYESMVHWCRDLEHDQGQKIILEKYRNDYTDVMAGAAFSLSLAGYNTTLETLAIGTPALFVPKYSYARGKITYSLEQLYRLERLQQTGYASHVHPQKVQDANKFADIILREFINATSDAEKRPKLNFKGADETVVAMQELLKDRSEAPKKYYESGKRASLLSDRPEWDKWKKRIIRMS
jgi:predicted glycosyltransferase